MTSAFEPQRPKADELFQFVLIVSLGWLVLVAPLIGPGQVFCPPAEAGDAANRHLPWMQFLRDSVRDGVFPLWNPHNGLGEPFLGNPETAVFFPLSWLYVALPMTTASFLAMVLKILVAALGMYVFARRLGMNHATAFIGGAAFGFMPHFILHASHVASNSEMCLPWALAATLEYIKTGRCRWAAALAGVLTLSLAGGAVQAWILTILFTGAFFLWFGRWDGTWRVRLRYLAGFLLALPLTLVTSGGLWLQYLEYFHRTEAAAFDRQFNLFLSPPAHLLHLLVPSFFGDLSHGNGWAWAGPRDVVLYAGVAVLLLALAHIFRRGGWHEKSFYLAAIFLFWLLCLRQPAALFGAIFRAAPLGGLDYPQLFGAFNLCLIVLALRALDGWRWSETRWPMAAAAATMASGVVLGAVIFRDFFRALDLGTFELRNHAVFVLFLLATIFTLRYWDRRRQLAFCALLGLVFADLYLVDRAFVGTVPLRRLPAGQDIVIDLSRSLPDAKDTRFYAPEIPADSNLFLKISVIGTNDPRVPERFGRVTTLLAPYPGTSREFREPDSASLSRIDAGTLQRQRVRSLIEIYGAARLRDIQSRPGNGPLGKVENLPLAGRLGVRYVLTRHRLETGDLHMLREGPNSSFLYAINGASRRMTFHQRVRWADTAAEAIARLVADPLGSWEEPVMVGTSPVANQPGPMGILEKDPAPRITFERMDALTVEASVQVPTGGWLMLRDLYDPGWQATVDGKPVRVIPANGVCRAVAVPPGAHRIRFSYQPASFRIGFLVGVLALLALCGWGVIGWYRWSTGRPKAS